MRAVAEDRLAASSPSFSKHIDRCLGCRACEQVCPAGVEYGQLLEASREQLLESQPKSGLTQLLLTFVLKHVWLSPGRLRFFFGAARVFRDLRLARLLVKTRIARLFSSRAEFACALLESSRRQDVPKDSFRLAAAQTDPTAKHVMMFTGCVGEGLFAGVNQATRRVLEVNKHSVDFPRSQVCCGALHAHAGDLVGAKQLARRNIKAFGEQDIPIITNSGGCGAMLKSYDHLLAGDDDFASRAQQFSARVRDVGQELELITAKDGSAIGPETVTYDASCHLLYGQHAAEASEGMLRHIPGLPFSSLTGSERCCGGAGIYNLLQPEMSAQVLQEKLGHVADTKARVLATGNPGCQMQIGAGAGLAGMKLRVCHPVELLDESYSRAGLYDHDNRT